MCRMTQIWAARSRWHHPYTDIERVAELFEVRADSIRRYLADPNHPFPQAADRVGARKLWALSPLYRYIDTCRPQLRSRIPRLCPLTDSLGPATFMGSTSFTPERMGWAYALHAWQPADGRGLVAVAYPEYLSHAASKVEIEQVAERFPNLTAIAFVTGTSTNVAHPWSQERQPEIYVYDRGYTGPFLRDDYGRASFGYGWFDLANLLRVDLPWFSSGLTDIEAIERWRPGAPVMRLTPGIGGKQFYAPNITEFGSSVLRTAEETALVNRVARHANQWIAQWNEYTEDGHDEQPNCPGLAQAAVAAIDDPGPPLSTADVTTVLHMRGPNHEAAARAQRAGWVAELWNPVIVDCSSLTVDQLGELGASWHARLKALPDAAGLELGFALPYGRIQRWRPPPVFLQDPQEPDMWIIQANNEIQITQPAAMRHAVGRLQRVELNSSFMGGFFVDDAGVSWPLPARNRHKYGIGSDSPRASELASTLSKLITDAAAPVAESGSPGSEVHRLRDHLIAMKAPLTMTRTEIAELLQ